MLHGQILNNKVLKILRLLLIIMIAIIINSNTDTEVIFKT